MINILKRSNYLILVAFFSGMVIMSVEMSASRLLAPFFGTSIFVWTNIIGLVMAALALGYYIGGKMSDKKPSRSLLLKIIVVASVMIIVIPFLVNPAVSLTTINIFSATPSSILILVGSFFATLVLFALPIMLLGMTSPFVIKLLTESKEVVGNTAGKVFAYSTIGSIVGTFLTTLVMIPTLGTKRTIIIGGLTLLIIAVVGLIKKEKKYLLLVLLMMPMVFFSNPSLNKTSGAIIDTESAYQYIKVEQDQEQNRYLIYNDALTINSVYNPDKILTGYYYDYFNLIPYLLSKEKIDVLIIGSAGGTIARQMNYFFGENAIHFDSVEIDNKVIEFSEKYFDNVYSNQTTYNDEGRMFLSHTDKKYDMIVIDAYNNQLQIPFHLTTREFFRDVSEHLNDDGVVSINVNAVSRESELLIAINNTIASVFGNVKVLPIGQSYNYVIAGSKQKLELEDIKNTINLELANVYGNAITQQYDFNYDAEKIILTDDKAPIEFMSDKMILEYIGGGK